MAEQRFGRLTAREAGPIIEELMGAQLNPLDQWGRPIPDTVFVQARAAPAPGGPQPRYGVTATAPTVDPDELTDTQLRQARKELEDRYRELGYDADGISLDGVKWRHPLNSLEGYLASRTAKAEAEARYPNSLQNGEGDAFRHAYWSYLLSKSIGADRAQQITDAYERSEGAPHRPGETIMDLSNNRFGRDLLTVSPVTDPAAAIAEAIRNGKLTTSPYRFTLPGPNK